MCEGRKPAINHGDDSYSVKVPLNFRVSLEGYPNQYRPRGLSRSAHNDTVKQKKEEEKGAKPLFPTCFLGTPYSPFSDIPE